MLHRTTAAAMALTLTALGAGAALAHDALTPVAHVETKGTGPTTLVLIPGLNCDWTAYESFMDRNAAKYTMHAVTLPGFGGSAAPPVPEGAKASQDLWLHNAEEAVVALIDQKKLSKPVVVGHSLGAYLAICIAEHSPDKIGGAVAIDGFAAFPMGAASMPVEQRRALVDEQIAPSMANQPAEQFAEFGKQMFRMMITDQKRADEMAAKQIPGVKPATTTRYYLELMAADATGGLKANKAPLLVVAALPAEGDKPFGVDAAQTRETWEAQFKDAGNTTITYVENSRHFIQEDQPAKLDEAIAKFVEGLKKK